jgi:[acyl-carrier-protein] S-malonyltransferase
MSQTAFLFPGQGAQHVGMGNQLVEKSATAKALFQQANDILGFDLAKLCFEGPQSELDKTDISQPALFVASLAALEVLKAESPEVVAGCTHTAGLSLGEYTALVFAGALSFEEGLRVVRARGVAMQAAAEATPSGMVSILMLDRDKVAELCQAASVAGPIQPANYLCPGNIVVSGVKPACAKIIELAEAAGAKVVPLSVAGAFHTDIMKPADERLAAALAGVKLGSPRIPVVSNVDARPHADPEEIRGLLVQQVLSPVRWEDSVRYLLEAGVESFYEVGPGKVLKGLMKRIDRKKEVVSVNDTP